MGGFSGRIHYPHPEAPRPSIEAARDISGFLDAFGRLQVDISRVHTARPAAGAFALVPDVVPGEPNHLIPSDDWGRDHYLAALRHYTGTFVPPTVAPVPNADVTRSVRATARQLYESLGDNLLSDEAIAARPSSESLFLDVRAARHVGVAAMSEASRASDAMAYTMESLLKCHLQDQAFLSVALSLCEQKDSEMAVLKNALRAAKREASSLPAPKMPMPPPPPPPAPLPPSDELVDRMQTQISEMTAELATANGEIRLFTEDVDRLERRARMQETLHQSLIATAIAPRHLDNLSNDLWTMLLPLYGRPLDRAQFQQLWNQLLENCFKHDLSNARFPRGPGPTDPPPPPPL